MRTTTINLSDGRAITLHEPTRAGLSLFLKVLPALETIGRAFNNGGSDIPDADLDALDAVLAHMADLDAAAVKALPLFDWMACLNALNELMPKDFLAARTGAPSNTTPPAA